MIAALIAGAGKRPRAGCPIPLPRQRIGRRKAEARRRGVAKRRSEEAYRRGRSEERGRRPGEDPARGVAKDSSPSEIDAGQARADGGPARI